MHAGETSGKNRWKVARAMRGTFKETYFKKWKSYKDPQSWQQRSDL